MSSYAHQPPIDDPGTVPVRPAATVMILADRPELEVLMVQRTSRAVFGPSAWVFPGGRVDPDDAQLLDVPANGRAWWFAGLRETVEEAGLVLGAGGAPLDVLEQIRDEVHADAGVFAQALADAELRLDLSGISEVARFITPLGPPRRFDTRFFMAAAPAGQTARHDAPAGQTARHDEQEVVEHVWIRPAEAIEQFRDGAFPLMSVTHRMLACLARYESSAAALAAAAEQREPQRGRVNDPEGAYEVVLPGEPGYETAEIEIEHGWVRI